MGRLSNYAQDLGMVTKKQALKIAPQDAQWSCYSGIQFYKVEKGVLLVSIPSIGPGWMASSNQPQDPVADLNMMHMSIRPYKGQ